MILSNSDPQNSVTNLEYGERTGFSWPHFGYAKVLLDRRKNVKKIQKKDQIWEWDKSGSTYGGNGWVMDGNVWEEYMLGHWTKYLEVERKIKVGERVGSPLCMNGSMSHSHLNVIKARIEDDHGWNWNLKIMALEDENPVMVAKERMGDLGDQRFLKNNESQVEYKREFLAGKNVQPWWMLLGYQA